MQPAAYGKAWRLEPWTGNPAGCCNPAELQTQPSPGFDLSAEVNCKELRVASMRLEVARSSASGRIMHAGKEQGLLRLPGTRVPREGRHSHELRGSANRLSAGFDLRCSVRSSCIVRASPPLGHHHDPGSDQAAQHPPASAAAMTLLELGMQTEGVVSATRSAVLPFCPFAQALRCILRDRVSGSPTCTYYIT